MDAVAYLIIITSAWSGAGSFGYEFPTMDACRQAITEMKVASKGDAIAAFCSSKPPQWMIDVYPERFPQFQQSKKK